tara:strand:+ start:239 stop:415 length:177 start_codon:yes stop_codon:yes gene_type:complete
VKKKQRSKVGVIRMFLQKQKITLKTFSIQYSKMHGNTVSKASRLRIVFILPPKIIKKK